MDFRLLNGEERKLINFMNIALLGTSFFWPAKYLIDQNEIVRYAHFGEGNYEETEMAIVKLLNTVPKSGEITAETVDFRGIGTPETYIGSGRRANYVESDNQLKLNQWTLTGDWKDEEEKSVSQSPNATIKMRFEAAKANLVIGGYGQADVFIDGKAASEINSGKDVKNGRMKLDGERLYELTDFGEDYGEHEIEIIFLQPNVSLFAWTFG